MLALAAVSFWIIRAQGLVYGYFNFLQIARYPDVIFPRMFRFVFGWIIPVIIVANIPARLLIKPLSDPVWLDVSPDGCRLHRAGSFADFLEFRAPALFQRELVKKRRKFRPRRPGFHGEISPCASGQMLLSKPPLAPGERRCCLNYG